MQCESEGFFLYEKEWSLKRIFELGGKHQLRINQQYVIRKRLLP